MFRFRRKRKAPNPLIWSFRKSAHFGRSVRWNKVPNRGALGRSSGKSHRLIAVSGWTEYVWGGRNRRVSAEKEWKINGRGLSVLSFRDAHEIPISCPSFIFLPSFAASLHLSFFSSKPAQSITHRATVPQRKRKRSVFFPSAAWNPLWLHFREQRNK